MENVFDSLTDIILILFLIVTLLSISLNVIFKYFEIPTIIGYVLSGTIVSQIFSVESNPYLSHIAEFGIVFLMFTIGLEFSAKHLWSMKKDVFINGFLQIFLTGIVYTYVAKSVFALDDRSAIIVGFALALSSTAIVLKILNDNGDIQTVYGRKTLGILLFQDIAVIPLLILIQIFTNTQDSVVSLLTKTTISAVIVVFCLFIIARYLINNIFLTIIKTDSQETFIATILFIVIGASYLAHYFDFSYSLGAFLAGMMLAETKFKYSIEANLIPFRDLLLGLFFITVGMQVNFVVIQKYFFMIIGLTISIMIIKTIIIYAIVRFSKNKRISFKAAIAISQVGEFALAIFELAKTNGILNKEVSQILVIVVILSMFITPFILKKIKHFADIVTTSTKEDEFKLKSAPTSGHVVLVGYSKLGQAIAKKLHDIGINYVIIDYDIARVQLGQELNEPIIYGNAALRYILVQAKVKTSRAVIIAITNAKSFEIICQNIRSFRQRIHTVVKVGDENEKNILKDYNIKNVIDETDEIATILVERALEQEIVLN